MRVPCRCVLALAALAAGSLLVAACGGGDQGPPSTMMSPTPTSEGATDPCIRSGDPELLLQCERFSQRAYWLGRELAIPGVDDLVFISSYIDDGDQPISSRTRLALIYGPKHSATQRAEAIYLYEWYRPTWEDHVAQFKGYDPSTVPAGGPVNWWQHPCVEEEVYKENGAEIHLFKAHLASLIYIPPMTAEEVAQCLDRPVGAVGAHVYFEDTVVEFEVQDNVAPAELARPAPVAPGTTPSAESTPPPFPTLVLQAKHPYNDETIVRRIAASLRPYEGAVTPAGPSAAYSSATPKPTPSPMTVAMLLTSTVQAARETVGG